MKQTEKKYAIAVDATKCIDCKACMIACKVENRLPIGYWRNWIKDNSPKNGIHTQFQPGQCMQCDTPSCVPACPVGATFKGKDGLVEIDPKTCIGCGNCITACPYDARYRNPETATADKCDFCSHRIAIGEEPACVKTCPTHTRVFGDLNDPDSEISKLLKARKHIQIINPLVNTKPNIFYTEQTALLNWPEEPTLPGNIHMSPAFWKDSK